MLLALLAHHGEIWCHGTTLQIVVPRQSGTERKKKKEEERDGKLSTSPIHAEYPPFPILVSSRPAEELEYLLPQ